MTTKDDKGRHKKRGNAARSLRNATIVSKAIAGEKTQAIADEMGIARQTVSEVLNSDSVKDTVKDINERLKVGVLKAIARVLSTIDNDGDPATAYRAAKELLKNFGSMKDGIDINVSEKRRVIVTIKREGETDEDQD